MALGYTELTNTRDLIIGTNYITVSKGFSGHFAMECRIDEEGYPAPQQTGFARYDDRDLAVAEAKSWARNEDLPLYI
jgi:hypothetical protein